MYRVEKVNRFCNIKVNFFEWAQCSTVAENTVLDKNISVKIRCFLASNNV